MDKRRIDIIHYREIIFTEYRMMNNFSCRIFSASRVDNTLSKNNLYNHAFVFAAIATSINISFLAPIVCSTGYNGELGWYVTYQCLNYVPFPLE